MTKFDFKSVSDWLLISGFVIALGLPLAEKFLHWDPVPRANENRTLTPPPEWVWNLKGIRQFPSKWEAYYNDHFGWRNSLLQWHSRILVLGLRQSLSDDIVIGHQGWLYTANDGTLRDFQGQLPLTEEELIFFRQTLEQRRDWLAKQKCRFLFILTPDKQTVYPEFLPDYLRNKGGKTRADQLVEHLQTFSDIDFIDARELLRKNKNLGTLFYLTDTHWNDLGAWLVYREVVNYLQKDFSAIAPASLDQLQKEESPFQGDLALVLGLSRDLSEKAIQLQFRKGRKSSEEKHPAFRITQVKDSDLPKALIHRDSFFNALIPFTSEIFQKAIYVWDYTLNTKVFNKEKPDIVILEMVERMIPKLPPNSAALRERPLADEFYESQQICLKLEAQSLSEWKTKELKVSSESNLLSMQPLSANAQWILPKFHFPSNHAFVVKVKITSPNHKKLRLLYKIKTDPKYRTWRQLTYKLQPGFNEGWFYLSHPLIAEALRFDFEDSDRPYQIQAVEIRAIPL